MSVLKAFRGLACAEGVEASCDVPLSQHTSYRIGGPADLMLLVHSYSGLQRALRTLAAEGVPWVVLGRGTNVLAADEGYRGAVIRLGREFSRISADGELITAGAAVMMPKLVNETLGRGLSGLECCAGIPGTVGGAVSMDAGSRHRWIGHAVRDVVTLRPSQGLRRIGGSDIEWGYRWCSIPAGELILEATFELARSDKASVAAEMNRLLARRRATQPVGRACCGSVFKNPGERSAAAMIDACGLKGTSEGAATISEQHANFVINRGGARAAEVVSLMRRMHDAVLERFGVELVPEVKFLGFDCEVS